MAEEVHVIKGGNGEKITWPDPSSGWLAKGSFVKTVTPSPPPERES
jgi:hypothetical protein